MSESALDESFQHWLTHEYTKGMTTQEALRSAFEVGATSGAQAQKDKDLAAVPTTWLDPMLSGEQAVIGNGPYRCTDIERVLKAVAERIKGE